MRHSRWKKISELENIVTETIQTASQGEKWRKQKKTRHNLWDEAKAVLKIIFRVLNAYVIKKEKFKLKTGEIGFLPSLAQDLEPVQLLKN